MVTLEQYPDASTDRMVLAFKIDRYRILTAKGWNGVILEMIRELLKFTPELEELVNRKLYEESARKGYSCGCGSITLSLEGIDEFEDYYEEHVRCVGCGKHLNFYKGKDTPSLIASEADLASDPSTFLRTLSLDEYGLILLRAVMEKL